MTNRKSNVRTGAGRSALRGTLVLIAGGGALIAATTLHAGPARSGWIERGNDRLSAEQDAQNVTALLDGMRGTPPVACRLATRALQNNFGPHGMVPGPESIGAANDAVFDWAVSNSIDASAMPQLKSALDNDDMCVRRTAAALLGRLRAPSGLAGELSAQLTSANPRTREAALLAVAYGGRKTDRATVERSLRDADPAVRTAAVWALGMIGDEASVPALSAFLRDTDAVMRANAAYALGSIGSDKAIPSLSDLLSSDPDAGVRRAAAAALGRIGD